MLRDLSNTRPEAERRRHALAVTNRCGSIVAPGFSHGKPRRIFVLRHPRFMVKPTETVLRSATLSTPGGRKRTMVILTRLPAGKEETMEGCKHTRSKPVEGWM